ncbi:unnamed protein product [Hymenolepis diminuta]|uniref:BLVR domain-containing protein n=1 Tax=Hymenolepis diminuta TaxID=6216 RepID=A0A0R3SNU7_HYMDI|nr:unnamed protein product [Hymenolepis diminuta]
MQKREIDRNYKYLSKIADGRKSALDRQIIEPAEVVVVDESDDDELAEVPSYDSADADSVDLVVSSFPSVSVNTLPKTAKTNKIKNRRRCILLPL